MNHKELQMLVSTSLDDEILESDQATVTKHLENCPECRRFVIYAKQLREHIHTLGEADLSSAFSVQVARSVERRDEQNTEWLGIEPLARNTFFALAVVVFIVFILSNYMNSSATFTGDQLLGGITVDSASTRVLLQQDNLSKNDLLYAVMTK